MNRYIHTCCLRARLWLLALPMLLASACSELTVDEQAGAARELRFIRLALVVNSGTQPAATTRAGQSPAGDGQETGFTRESALSGLTLILFEGDLNTADAGQKLALVQYYTSAQITAQTTTHTGYEACYVTAVRQLPDDFDATKQYQAIAVANINLEASLQTVGQLRDFTVGRRTLFTGDTPAAATNFAMASPRVTTFDFTKATLRKTYKAGDDNSYLFDFADADNGAPIELERLAARIDFWTKCESHQVSWDDAHQGYRYDCGDGVYFVLQQIAPFNLYDEQEYLLKHLSTNAADATTPVTLLSGETTTNLVVDPKTAQKQTTKLSYQSPLNADIMSSSTMQTIAALRTNGTMKTDLTLTGTNTTLNEDVIVAYPMENTLLNGTSPLKTYATGVALKGTFYRTADNAEISQRTYYVYLRHQDNTTGYTMQATELTAANLAADTRAADDNVHQFGVVRNNIYRITIDQIPPQQDWIRITIRVKKWDPFVHGDIWL